MPIALHHTATHAATRCSTLCNTLQHTATHCNTLQHNATHHHAPGLLYADYGCILLVSLPVPVRHTNACATHQRGNTCSCKPSKSRVCGKESPQMLLRLRRKMERRTMMKRCLSFCRHRGHRTPAAHPPTLAIPRWIITPRRLVPKTPRRPLIRRPLI